MTLRANQRETLRVIGSCPKFGLSYFGVAEALDISNDAAERRLDRLLAAGLVEPYRFRGGAAFRATVITPKGRELL